MNRCYRKIIAFLVSAIFILQCFPTNLVAHADTDWIGYTAISTKEELNNIRNNLSGNYYLTCDIVFTEADFAEGGSFYNGGTGWQPIGTSYKAAFEGVLDGNGHTISGLYCNLTSSTEMASAGLFGYNDGEIQNIGMVGGNIKVTSSSPDSYVGGIAGYSLGGLINNCYNTGSVGSSSPYVHAGGIVGYNSSSTISNCYNTGIVDAALAYSDAGGIVGFNHSGTISNCYNTGRIRSFNLEGGIVCTDLYGTFSNCYYLNITSRGIGSGLDTTTSLTLDQMKQKSSYSGFDFDNTWIFNENGTYKFPTLQGVNHIEKSENTIDFDGGNGTTYDPFKISNYNQLNKVRADFAACYVLTSNIVFTSADFETSGTFYNGGAGWEPIGINPKSAFTGIFDGNGYTISGLYCSITSSSSDVYAGLFGCNKGMIKNLGIVGGSIKAATTSYYDADAGEIVGYNDNGTIDNCYSTGSVNTTSALVANVGGIAGDSSGGAITNCYNSGNVSATSYYVNAGGIVGSNYVSTIINCNNIGNVDVVASSSANAGGIAGDNNGKISNCNNKGSVSIATSLAYNSFAQLGGIVGSLWGSSGAISNSYNTGSVSTTSYYTDIGGIAGEINFGTINNCYNIGSIIATSTSKVHAGGIAGSLFVSTISNSYNTGSVSTTISSDYPSFAYTGGISGYNQHNDTISNCYNIGKVNATATKASSANAGGITGYCNSGIFNNCFYLNNISKGICEGSDTTTSLTLYQMEQQSFYNGFDFTDTWQINNYLPYLRAIPYVQLDSLSFETINIQISATGTFQTKLISSPRFPTFTNIEYTSLNAAIAEVDQNGLISAVSTGTTTIIAKDLITNKTATCTINIVQVVTGITINGSNYVNDNNKLQLTTNVFPTNAGNKALTWSSSDTNVASVDQNGLVSTYKGGTVTIYATSTDGTNIKGSFTLTVIVRPQSISLDQTNMSLITGQIKKLIATVRPDDASNKKVTWSSDNTAVATISSDGTVLAIAPGNATITCRSTDGSKVTATCNVKVVAKVVSKITMSSQPTKTSYIQGQSLDLTGAKILATYNDGSTQTVNVSSGMVSGFDSNKVGEQTITVTYNGKAITFKLSVIAKYSLKLDKNDGSPVTLLSFAAGTVIQSPSNPTRTGYTFNGWYTAASGGTAIKFPRTITANTTVYAHWNAATPSTPTTVKAVSTNYNTINVSWAKANNANLYKVYRATSSSGTYTYLGSTSGSSYTGTGLTTNKTYYYKVKAVFKTTGKTSGYSAIVSAKPIPATVALTSVIKASTTSAKVTYTAVSGASGYEVCYSTSSTGTYIKATTTKGTLYTKAGLTAKKVYYFKVRAYCMVGTTKVYGNYSAVKSVQL